MMKIPHIFLICIVMIAAPSFVHSSQFVTYGELIKELESIAKTRLEPSEVLQKEFVRLQKTHGISGDQKTYRDFVRVRLAFEATRDSGLWQIRWKVTDKEPNSDLIWKQWRQQTAPKYATEKSAKATAEAECDELSALFAFIARSLGVKRVGLFWPTFNHTVAVWTPNDKEGNPVRIVVPTSQIFISSKATLGTREFDPEKQKIIYDYHRKDVPSTHKIPAPLAEMMIAQVKKFAGKSSQFLQARRNRLSHQFGGS